MAINLRQPIQTQGAEKGSGLLGSSAFLSLGLIILVLLVFGGLRTYSSVLEGNIETTKAEISQESNSLPSPEVNRVISFQQRLDKISELAVKNDPTMLLRELEKVSFPGTMITALKYSGRSVEVTLTADNFQTVAKQILSFKKSTYFQDVSTGATTRDTKGKIVFVLKAGTVN